MEQKLSIFNTSLGQLISGNQAWPRRVKFYLLLDFLSYITFEMFCIIWKGVPRNGPFVFFDFQLLLKIMGLFMFLASEISGKNATFAAN